MLNDRVADAEALYRAGRTVETVGATEGVADSADTPESSARLLTLRGMALFDLGDVVGSIETLRRATDLARRGSPRLQFDTAFQLFLRETDFQSPDEALPSLAGLRLLATQVGDAHALTGLHLAVARIEALRGHCIDAHRHLEIARRLADQTGSIGPRCLVDIVEASLESVSGNLHRSRRLAETCLERAEAAGFSKYVLAAKTNLAVLSLYAGKVEIARELLTGVLDAASGFTYVRLGAMDSLAQVELAQGNLAACEALLEQCQQIIKSDRLPTRSWYDLAHQVTRCAYYDRLEHWRRVVEICDETDAELARRQYKAVRTSLLCAKARALARLGRHTHAEATLATAMRACPRGAVDPLIVLEASRAVCATLRGDAANGAAHFDRAIAASRAIGHRHHETWIGRERATMASAVVRSTPRGLEVGDAAMLMNDVAAMLGAGHSIDLLSQRLTSILQSTSINARVDVEHETGCDYDPEPSAAWEAGADGVFSIRLRGSDRRVRLRVRGVQTIEEISLLKSVADVVEAAVHRTADADTEDENQHLWPRAMAPQGEDAIFRSPRMVELVKIAARLANSDLPILITGETGTGKEIVAKLIHDASRVKRGPFVPFNCSAVPRELVESQLFGHRRGAFTGATDAFPGVIRSAERGTLFLDEIGDLDAAAQPKLLRFLESGEIHPVGEMRASRVAVRIVAATNADLDTMMEQGRFRRDLLYRLGVARLALPPLRERKDEIPALAALFLARFARECHRTHVRLGDDALAALVLFDWPGNIRQLANEVRRLVAMAADGDVISSADLSPEILVRWNARPVVETTPVRPSPRVSIRLDQSLSDAVAELEEHFISRAMQDAGGRVSDAAQLLGLSRKGLFLKRRRRGLLEH